MYILKYTYTFNRYILIHLKFKYLQFKRLLKSSTETHFLIQAKAAHSNRTHYEQFLFATECHSTPYLPLSSRNL